MRVDAMTRYAYVAVDAEGRERTGALDAASESAARARLSRQRLMPVRITAASGAPAVQKDQHTAPWRDARLSRRALSLFVRQLATLVDASVPIDEALGLIAAQQEQASARRIIADVQEGVIEGLRLAQALGRHPRSFPPLVRAAVAGGERAGALGQVLTRLADHLARADALRTKALTAMIYPIALTIVATGVICALMIFVVPSLSEQFRAFDAKLPLITQVLIGVSTAMSQYWPLILAAAAGLALLARAALAQPHVALAVDRAWMGAPVFGKWVKALNASRVARAVATLTSSGLPVLDSVRAAGDSVSNRHVAQRIDAMATAIEEGEQFSVALRKAAIAPPLVSYMAASGEGAGELAKMLEKAADHLDQEFEAASNAAVSLFEPALIVVMGAIVAAIVLAIMLPLLQLNQMAIG
jgi:general secretion pathway protein F